MIPTDSPAPPRARQRRRMIAVVFAVILLGTGIAAVVLSGGLRNLIQGHSTVVASTATSTEEGPLVKVVIPKKVQAMPITVEQIAVVEPYYRADLRARASGIVRRVNRDIGDAVKAGDVLIEIDVPESEQEVARCEAMIRQREQELKVSQAKLKDAVASREVSAATIKQREADVQAATATRDLKKRKYERYKDLAARGSVVGNVVEEEERDYLSSEASVTAARANVERARADYAESDSKIEAAAADIELKRAQIDVARKDRDRAAVVVGFGHVVAPFDGVVVRRTVDPGSFVQNATTGATESLISVARVDLVSVTAKFPDSAAPYIATATPAIVTIDDLPDLSISTRVTRFSPSVQNTDRTMPVEVDVFNGSDAEYEQLQQTMAASSATHRPTKGVNDTIPVRAYPQGSARSGRLIPGMTGSIKLAIGGFGESCVLPRSAVYSRSGVNYIMIVEANRTRQLPVRLQLTDGERVRVAIIDRKNDAAGGSREVLRELTGREHVVLSRQLEIGDGTTIRPAPTDW